MSAQVRWSLWCSWCLCCCDLACDEVEAGDGDGDGDGEASATHQQRRVKPEWILPSTLRLHFSRQLKEDEVCKILHADILQCYKQLFLMLQHV